MDGIRTIVFDLDGTIYQNFTFHRDYIGFLVEGTDAAPWRDALIAFAEDVLAGRRLVMNAFYRSAVLPKTGTPEAYFTLLESAHAETLTMADMPPREEYTYLGDAWAVVTLLGRTLGLLSAERSSEVYRRTRRKMEADGMRGDPVLRDAIVRLRECYKTVLLTNSYEQTALEFLGQLGFNGAFDRMGFSANKPYGLADALIAQCADALDDPGSVLAVGDHAFNDLAPLAQRGCRTLWINPYPGVHEAPHDDAVKTLDQLAAYLRALCA